MVLDKTKIMELLAKDANDFDTIRRGREDGIFIRTTGDLNEFDPDTQIGNDSIDISLGEYGYIMKSNQYDYINTLSGEDFEKFYQKVDFKKEGFILKPGSLLLAPTYERIGISGNLMGRVTGRSVFARMGLSVHCTQDKFASGINSVVGLQIINNSPVSLKIFPRQRIAQLLVEITDDTMRNNAYTGHYCEEEDFTLPIVQQKDRDFYGSRDKNIIERQKSKPISIVKKYSTDMSISISRCIVAAVGAAAMAAFGTYNQTVGIYIIAVAQAMFEILLFIIDYNRRKDSDDAKD